MNEMMMKSLIKMLGVDPEALIAQAGEGVRQIQGYGIHFANQLNRIEANQHEIMAKLGISDKIAVKQIPDNLEEG